MGIERGIEKKQRETDRQVSQVKIIITHSIHHYQFTVAMVYYSLRHSKTWMLLLKRYVIVQQLAPPPLHTHTHTHMHTCTHAHILTQLFSINPSSSLDLIFVYQTPAVIYLHTVHSLVSYQDPWSGYKTIHSYD